MYTAKQRYNEANLDEQTTCWNIMTQKNSRGTTQKTTWQFFSRQTVSFASTSLWMEVSVVVCEIWPCQQVPARGAQRWHSWEKQPAAAADNFTYV